MLMSADGGWWDKCACRVAHCEDQNGRNEEDIHVGSGWLVVRYLGCLWNVGGIFDFVSKGCVSSSLRLQEKFASVIGLLSGPPHSLLYLILARGTMYCEPFFEGKRLGRYAAPACSNSRKKAKLASVEQRAFRIPASRQPGRKSTN